MKEYLTVVYKINCDKTVFDEWWATMHPAFPEKGTAPIQITAFSKGDVISELDELETSHGHP